MTISQVKNIEEFAAKLGENAEGVVDIRTLLELSEAYGIREWLTFDASVVRGLSYYTGVVFEGFDKSGELRAICGGGRYDQLLETMGGESVPAVGFGFGDAVGGLQLLPAYCVLTACVRCWRSILPCCSLPRLERPLHTSSTRPVHTYHYFILLLSYIEGVLTRHCAFATISATIASSIIHCFAIFFPISVIIFDCMKVIVELLKMKNILPDFSKSKVDAILFPVTSEQRGQAMATAAALRGAGLKVDLILEEKKTKWVFQRADKCNAGPFGSLTQAT